MDRKPKEKCEAKSENPRLLKKVDITVKTYPDLQPFLEMIVLILEGVYEHMAQVSSPECQLQS